MPQLSTLCKALKRLREEADDQLIKEEQGKLRREIGMKGENQALKFHTVSRIAVALGVTRQAVEKTLKDVPPSGHKVVCGVMAKAWTVAALPEFMRAKLAEIARGRGFRGADELIEGADEPWRTPLPLAQIEAQFIEHATLLQNALLPSLGRRNDTTINAGEFMRLGLDDYRRAFGHAVSADHWRRLLNRTLERDRGLEQWARVELFLDDAAFRKRAKPEAVRNQYLHRELADALEFLSSRTAPTGDDKAYFLDAAFAHFEALVDANPSDKRRIKASLIEYMRRELPALSAGGEGAWRRLFDFRYAQWREGGKNPPCLMDKRAENSGRRRPEEIEAEVKVLAFEAARQEGNIAGARRRLQREGRIPNITALYKFDPRKDKSAVPETIRRGVDDILARAHPSMKGPRSERKALPKGSRDWSDNFPGDEIEADDLTIPIYWRDADENGLPIIVRGECLVACDRRSRMILDCLLTPGKYSAIHIRLLILKVLRKYGAPRFNFLFENGSWRSLRIKGVEHVGSVPWRTTALLLSNHFEGLRFGSSTTSRIGGLAEAGVSVRNAIPGNPETKIIEGIFNVVQNMMAVEPGFVGRNERLSGYDGALRMIANARAAVKRGEVYSPALDELYTKEEIVRVLEVVFFNYNNDPQNGKMLQGKTPSEAWSEHIARHPLKKLPPEAEFLVASDMTKTKVRRDGSFHIKRTTNESPRVFFNEQTDALSRSKEVLVFWHPENPGLITVTDLHMKNPFIVKEQVLPSRTATPEQIAEVSRTRAAIRDSRRALLSDIRAPIINTITRDRDVPEHVRETGREMQEQIAEAKAEETKVKCERAKVEKLARERGIDPTHIRNTERFMESVLREEQLQRKINEAIQKGELT